MSAQLQQQDRGAYLTRVASKGRVWLLPAFGLLLALSTIRQQPPVQTDFEGYAGFVTTGEFLLNHLVASIGGAALAACARCLSCWPAVVSAVALVRTSPRLRVAGILYAVSAPLFVWSGPVDLIPRQALAGLLLTLAAVLIALRLPREA